jgi:hypothetical protein
MGSLQTTLVFIDIYGLKVRSQDLLKTDSSIDIYGLKVRSQELLKTDSSFKQVLGGY